MARIDADNDPAQTEGKPEHLTAVEQTDAGQLRPHNEDYLGSVVPQDPDQLEHKGALYLVADGMGGHQAGEVASQEAVEAVIEHYYEDPSRDIPGSLTRAFQAANQTIYEQASSNPATAGMGTTLVAAVVRGRKAYVANVGDSRAYSIGRKGIRQITDDHSWVEEQVRAGLLSPERARRHPQRNLITRALGSRPTVDVDLFETRIRKGDAILLCSDGLTNHVEDGEIEATLRSYPAEEAVEALVAMANERGGSDNISVVLLGRPNRTGPSAGEETGSDLPTLAIVVGVLAIISLVVLALWIYFRSPAPFLP
jgi:serine/threonine protein phosphatase PrpC